MVEKQRLGKGLGALIPLPEVAVSEVSKVPLQGPWTAALISTDTAAAHDVAMTSIPSREEVTRRVRDQLGPDSIVGRVMALLPTIQTEVGRGNSDVIIVAYGRNRPGILAAIAGVLADHKCDIVDIKHTLREGQFVLTLAVAAGSAISSRELQSALAQPAAEFGIQISVLDGAANESVR